MIKNIGLKSAIVEIEMFNIELNADVECQTNLDGGSNLWPLLNWVQVNM